MGDNIYNSYEDQRNRAATARGWYNNNTQQYYQNNQAADSRSWTDRSQIAYSANRYRTPQSAYTHVNGYTQNPSVPTATPTFPTYQYNVAAQPAAVQAPSFESYPRLSSVPPPPPPPLPAKTWPDNETQRFNGPYPARTQEQESYQRQQYSNPPPPYNNTVSHYRNYGAPASRYPNYDRRYNGHEHMSAHHMPPPNMPYYNHYYRRSSESEDGEGRPRKKKKIAQKAHEDKFKVEDCEKALALEKQLNTMSKNSLIVRFPDFEITRDMVLDYDRDSINGVYFPSPISQRICFLALNPEANADKVIEKINQIKPEGANGYLKAEYKQNKADSQNVEPEDIDPLTLYVGNLAQEVTKEEIVRIYPNNRRIDIGYAKKMKFTRYAFVSFNTIEESLSAFENSFSKIMHGKSLIVRFKRLHGTNGQPGEPKTPKSCHKEGEVSENGSQPEIDHSAYEECEESEDDLFDLTRVKEEPKDSDSYYLPGNVDEMLMSFRAKSLPVKGSDGDEILVKPDITAIKIKQEPVGDTDESTLLTEIKKEGDVDSNTTDNSKNSSESNSLLNGESIPVENGECKQIGLNSTVAEIKEETDNEDDDVDEDELFKKADMLLNKMKNGCTRPENVETTKK